MTRTIEVVPYDPGWPGRFALEAEALRGVFGSAVKAIHHIGSTAVPGLAAKPVIDILVVLDDTADVGRFDEAMVMLGYRIRGECLDAGGTPGRFYYSKPSQGKRTHHVHVCAEGHFQIPELVLFPRYLRERPDVAVAYAELKAQALGEGDGDNERYMARKHTWIGGAVRDALAHFGEPDRRSALGGGVVPDPPAAG
ncbi:MAG: GrpB family protein [Longimicrobiales bacterium]